MEEIFLQLSLVLLIILGISFIMRMLKQPLIIGYIIAGIIIGPSFFNLLSNNETINTFSQLGIAFLLFIVGLNLSPKVIKEVGKISLITGVGQVIFTSIVGYFIARGLGFPAITSLYISIALTFSSTIIILKLLSDKDSLDKLFGKISIGFLLVQDLIAIITILIISSFSNGIGTTGFIFENFINGILILVILFSLSYFILPKISSFLSKSQEFLFIFAISWGLGLAALFFYVGFSFEIGALVAGIMLSMSPYSYEVSSKLKPLRDFFIISFFVLLGSQLIIQELNNLWIPAIIFSLFVLIGNPIIMMILMGMSGYSKNTGFMTGLIVAQVSEFSLILIALGVRLGHIPQEILSFLTIIALITIAGSTYLIMYADKIYPFISDYLRIFERKNIKEKELLKDNYYEYLLLGENRIGFSIMKSFIHQKKNYIIIDYNPERVKKLKAKGINSIYGDVSNSDLIDSMRIGRAKMIVSTIPEKEINLMILEKIKERNRKAIVIVTARTISDTLELYKKGADYVILPHFLGGEYTAKIIEKCQENKRLYESEKNKHINDIKERLKEGQQHPSKEGYYK